MVISNSRALEGIEDTCTRSVVAQLWIVCFRSPRVISINRNSPSRIRQGELAVMTVNFPARPFSLDLSFSSLFTSHLTLFSPVKRFLSVDRDKALLKFVTPELCGIKEFSTTFEKLETICSMTGEIFIFFSALTRYNIVKFFKHIFEGTYETNWIWKISCYIVRFSLSAVSFDGKVMEKFCRDFEKKTKATFVYVELNFQ